MRLAAIDWIIIAVFIIFITAIGIIASRKAAGKKEDFLVARTQRWIICGSGIGSCR